MWSFGKMSLLRSRWNLYLGISYYFRPLGSFHSPKCWLPEHLLVSSNPKAKIQNPFLLNWFFWGQTVSFLGHFTSEPRLFHRFNTILTFPIRPAGGIVSLLITTTIFFFFRKRGNQASTCSVPTPLWGVWSQPNASSCRKICLPLGFYSDGWGFRVEITLSQMDRCSNTHRHAINIYNDAAGIFFANRPL